MPREERADRRFPRRLYGEGKEPDPRFSLANERTFLAWMRTSLALLAAGVALEALQLPIDEDLRFASALVFIVLGLLAPMQAWLGWLATERALRHSQALPSPPLGLLTAVGTTTAGLLVLVGLFLR
jgi:putative membrane protein